MSDKLVIAAADSTFRCERTDRKSGDQCIYAKAPGEQFCTKHLASTAFYKKRKIKSHYKLELYQQSLDAQTHRSDIKCLIEEIHLTRECTQHILDLVNIDDDIIQYTPQLLALVRLTQDIAITLHKIEASTVTLLDKGVLFDMAEGILNRLQAPYGPLDHDESLDLTDTLLSIIADKMGAGSKVPPKTTNNQDTNIHYRLEHWNIHLKTYYQDSRISDLRSELALARIILEVTLKKITTAAGVLHNIAKIITTISTIRSLCNTIQLIDYQSGNLLDRTDVLIVAQRIAEEIAKAVPEDLLSELSEDLKVIFEDILPQEDEDDDNLNTILALEYNNPSQVPLIGMTE